MNASDTKPIAPAPPSDARDESSDARDESSGSETSEESEPPVLGYNSKTGSWHCVMCGEDMDPHNPRQLCRKSYCGGIDWSTICADRSSRSIGFAPGSSSER